MRPLLRSTLSLIALGAISAGVQAQYTEEEEALLGLYGDEELISIATGSYQPIAKAPAVSSVITAEDIRKMGATDIDDVLETVPGLHVARSFLGYNPIYTFRGMYTDYNPQVLMLINGIPINTLHQGDRHPVWGGMPVEAIQRIEVIRGPGSAVYGADAFAGVINIHTKTRQDIKKAEFGVRAGSFDTQDYWALYGDDWGDFEVAAMLEYHTTDGQRRTITADGATALGSSLAPGSVELSRENLDARIDIAYQLWRFRAGLQRRRDWGIGAGLGSAIDPHGRFKSDRWNADLTYHDPYFTSDWDIQAQASFRHVSQEVEKNPWILPPGTTIIPVVSDFPDGMIGTPEDWERHWRFDFTAFYTGIERHKIRIGSGYAIGDTYKVKESKNFLLLPVPGGALPISLGSLVDVSDTAAVYLPEESRHYHYLSLQDVWQFANDWELTAGLRYDDYSDFGETFNPRLALVWSTTHSLTNKFLFGRAFRSPSFIEAYAINNPVTLGNNNLDPETIQTFEWAVDYNYSETIHLGLNIFKYKWKDIIQFVPGPTGNVAENAGKQTGYGLELEASWQARDNLKLMGNYAYQRSKDKKLDHVAGNAPNHQIFARADWEFRPSWHLDTRINWVGERDRAEGDTRNDLDDYTMVDMTLRYKHENNPWEIAIAGRNLFNTDAREPTTGANAAALPNDLPLAGRNYFVEFRYSPE